MRSNIKLGLYDLLPTALLTLLNHIIGKLTGNPLFPNLPVSIAEMTTLRDAFSQLIDDAIGGSIVARQARNQKVKEVRNALRATADYVRAQCDGDPALLSTSGFELAKQPEPVTVIAIPQNVRAGATDVAGEILLRWGRTEGAQMFRLERAMTDPTVGETTWVTVALTSRQRFVATGNEPYKACWFRVIAVGKEKEGLPSDVVMSRAA